jgi:alpha-ketoglutarate-dependent taurine dioxygenase
MNARIDLHALADVSVSPLLQSRDFPLVIRPHRAALDAVAWARAHREALDHLICRAGALLFRGFEFQRLDRFEAFVDVVSPDEWVDYREAATPRSTVQGHIATATEYPAELRIYVHNENSHVTSWPLYLFFHCRVPACEGGHTPLADCRAVYRRLAGGIAQRFLESGWLYRRNFVARNSLRWQKVFGTETCEGVERYCAENYMNARWNNGALTVRYRRWAALEHPRTKEYVWFNHGTFFNPYTLEPQIKELYGSLDEDALPYNTYYGDGTPVAIDVLRTLDEAYQAETISFPWQAGDVLMVDNMRLAHGRQAYRGERQVLVAMKSMVRCQDVAPPDTYSLPDANGPA